MPRKKPYVFVTRELPGKALERLGEYYEVEVWRKIPPPPRDVLLEKAREADALATLLTDKVDKELIDQAARLRIVSQYAVGYDNIDVAYATQKGIYVTNTPGVLTDSTADLTMALLLAVARRIIEAHEFVKKGEWSRYGTGWHPMLLLGTELRGKTLGIIGMGRIGQAVARRALGFGMRIIYYSRKRLPPEKEEELGGAKYVSLEELLRQSDFVSIHTPLTPQTRYMIGEKELKMMKPTAYIVNTARGAVIDTNALVKALKEKWIAGAALDVFEQEPLPEDHPLLELDNVVLAPHIGSATWEARTAMADLVAENLIAFAQGRVPPTLVNPDVLKVRKPGFEEYREDLEE